MNSVINVIVVVCKMFSLKLLTYFFRSNGSYKMNLRQFSTFCLTCECHFVFVFTVDMLCMQDTN